MQALSPSPSALRHIYLLWCSPQTGLWLGAGLCSSSACPGCVVNLLGNHLLGLVLGRGTKQASCANFVNLLGSVVSCVLVQNSEIFGWCFVVFIVGVWLLFSRKSLLVLYSFSVSPFDPQSLSFQFIFFLLLLAGFAGWCRESFLFLAVSLFSSTLSSSSSSLVLVLGRNFAFSCTQSLSLCLTAKY